MLTKQLLKQRYRILDSVGKGGMGAVYRAEDTQLGNRKVAVKEMSQSSLSPQEVVEAADAFKREAHILAGLQHPNLPNIYDHFSEGGRWYLVMSFIQGETLESYLDKANGGKLPVEQALQIGIQLCTVLNYLHIQQPPIIFRDLKPSNVMWTQDGHLYLIDFGIARHFKPGQAKDTAAYGSAGYASPEQYGKAQTTPQSDIYSLGAILHQMLSGNDPSSTPFRFAPLQTLGQPALTELAALITNMLEMDAQRRPASMAAVKQELERIADQQRHRAPQSPPWQNQPQAETSPGSRQYLLPQPSVSFPQQPEDAAQYPRRSSIGKVFSTIGMIIGVILVLTGCIMAFTSLVSVGLNLFPAGVADLFLGLMIFFIARIRKKSLPLSTAIRREFVIGIFVGATALLFGIGAIIITATNNIGIINYGSGGVNAGIITIIAGVIILWTMSIRIRKYHHLLNEQHVRD